MDWLYPLSGFVVGALVGLTGMGGGSLMTPLLILLFGVHPLTAVGTDLLYAAATKTAGTAIHSKKGNVDGRVAGLLAAGSVPATVLTIGVLSRVPKQSPTTAAIISMSIGVALIIAAVAIFFRRRIRDPHRRLRPCTRGAPHPCGRPGPLAHRQRGLVHCRCPAARFLAGHLNRKPPGDPHFRSLPAPRPGQHAGADRPAAHRLVNEHRLHRADADLPKMAGQAIGHAHMVVNDVSHGEAPGGLRSRLAMKRR